MKETRKEKVWMIIGVITLLIFGVGATFAYFIAEGGNAEQTNINVTTHTTDSLLFEVGKAISITADQTTFAPGSGNRTDNTFARAELKANSSTNNATEHYYVYLSIDTNEFTYSTTEKTAELILTITDPNGNPLTNINGLNYVTVGELSGFDITEEKNLITIANNYEITSTSTKIDEWNITLTLVNLDANQNANAGKSFNGTLMIQKEESFAGHIVSLYTIQGANNLYKHNSALENGVNDGSVRYAGGDYKINNVARTNYKRISKVSVDDTEALIGYLCDGKDTQTRDQCNFDSHYYLTYDDTVQFNSYEEALNKVIEDGYVTFSPINNFVCFGDDCADSNNLYRILGVTNSKIKLIKYDYADSNLLGTDGGYSLDYNDDESTIEDFGFSNSYRGNLNYVPYYTITPYDDLYNESNNGNYSRWISFWTLGDLNKINLNTNFVKNIGNKWSDKIEESVWYAGGTIWEKSAEFGAKSAYNYEVGPNRLKDGDLYNFKIPNSISTRSFVVEKASPTEKIGLINVYEYYYAFSPEFWTLPGNSWDTKDSSYYGAKNDVRIGLDTNWLYMGWDELTISRILDEEITFFSVSYDGSLSDPDAGAIRPTFYLKSSVTFDGGTGTLADPYRIA